MFVSYNFFPKLKPYTVEELDAILKSIKKEIKKESKEGFTICLPTLKLSLEKEDFGENWDTLKSEAKGEEYPEFIQDFVCDVLFQEYESFSDKRGDILSCWWDTEIAEKLKKKFNVNSHAIEFEVGVEMWEKYGKTILLTVEPSVRIEY